MVKFSSLVSATNQATDQVTNQAEYNNENSVPKRILKIIRQEPFLSQKKIANRIVENYSTVKYYMETMKKSGIIRREGVGRQVKLEAGNQVFQPLKK